MAEYNRDQANRIADSLWPPCTDDHDYDSTFRMMLTHDYGSQPEIRIPLNKLLAVIEELEAVSNIMRKAAPHFYRTPDVSNINKHRAQCDALRAKLVLLIPPMYAYHQKGDSDQP